MDSDGDGGGDGGHDGDGGGDGGSDGDGDSSDGVSGDDGDRFPNVIVPFTKTEK